MSYIHCWAFVLFLRCYWFPISYGQFSFLKIGNIAIITDLKKIFSSRNFSFALHATLIKLFSLFSYEFFARKIPRIPIFPFGSVLNFLLRIKFPVTFDDNFPLKIFHKSPIKNLSSDQFFYFGYFPNNILRIAIFPRSAWFFIFYSELNFPLRLIVIFR
jgi:hypothetical protein